MKKISAEHVLAAAGLLAAAGVAVLATRSAGPVKLSQFVELREGPLQEHLVSREELGTSPVLTPHYYPARVGPSITTCIARGFSPAWQSGDPQADALPAEVMW